MNIIPKLMSLTFVGAEWVLWILIVLSVVSVAVFIERGLFFYRFRAPLASAVGSVYGLLRKQNLTGAKEVSSGMKSMESIILVAGLSEMGSGIDSVREMMGAAKIRARIAMERNLSILGTLGSNAPFVGLFGTVLGIIKAFHDLSLRQSEGIGVVMSGISEALIATAVGLLVAIPAVVGFNLFGRMVRRRMADMDAFSQEVIALLQGVGPISSGIKTSGQGA